VLKTGYIMNDKMKNDRDLILIFSKIYLFIKRYFIILLLSAIIGIIFGWYKNHSAGYYFKKHLIVSSIVVEKYISSDMVYSLQKLVADNNFDVLAQNLNIPEKAAGSIIKIDTSTFRYRENIGFLIDFSFRDRIFEDTITSGFLYYLNNNDYFKKNTQLFIQEKRKLLDAINRSSESPENSLSSPNSTLSESQSEKTLFIRSASSEQIRLMDEKYRIEKDIEFGSKVSLISQSTARVFAGLGLTKSLLLYGLGIFILGVLLTLLIESLRLTRKYIKEQM